MYGAFANGTYDGGWFIGALGMVVDNLYHNRNGMPEGSEFVPCIVGDDRAGKYWSCLEYETNSRAGFAFIDRDDDGFGIVWDSKYRELSTRPMRAELWDSGLE